MSLAPKPKAAALVRRMAGKLHHHACLDCKLRYSCACKDPEHNARCQLCRPVRPNCRPLWDRSTDPDECCAEHCVLVTDAAFIDAHRLAGPGPWFQCPSCRRLHGFNPRKRRTP